MIGIFDSGIGGITVVKEIKRVLPKSPILYFGDTARLPYGNRSPEIIRKYVKEDIEFLISKGAKIIVAACNSASTVISDDFKSKFKAPIFDVISSAIEAAIKVTKNGRIGLIGTRATVNSGVYDEKLETRNKKLGDVNEVKMYFQACPLFVPLVEENWIKRQETKTIAKKYLQDLKLKNIDTLILGCTHYSFLKDVIARAIGKKVRLIDCAEQVAKAVQEEFENGRLKSINPPRLQAGGGKSEDKFYVSDLTPHFQDLAEKWLGEKIKLEKI